MWPDAPYDRHLTPPPSTPKVMISLRRSTRDVHPDQKVERSVEELMLRELVVEKNRQLNLRRRMGKRLDVFPSSFTISTHADLYLELIVCFLSPSNNNISVKK